MSVSPCFQGSSYTENLFLDAALLDKRKGPMGRSSSFLVSTFMYCMSKQT